MDPKKDYLEKMGYESRDIIVRTIGRWTIGLFVFVAIASAIALIYYRQVTPTRGEIAANQPMSTLRRLPPQPRLQAQPDKDLRVFNAAVDARMSTYGPSDPGYYHIPIDRAIDLTLQRGLPTRPSPAAGGTRPNSENGARTEPTAGQAALQPVGQTGGR